MIIEVEEKSTTGKQPIPKVVISTETITPFYILGRLFNCFRARGRNADTLFDS